MEHDLTTIRKVLEDSNSALETLEEIDRVELEIRNKEMVSEDVEAHDLYFHGWNNAFRRILREERGHGEVS